MLRRLAAIGVVTFLMAAPAEAQTIAGRWYGDLPNGGSIGLDLSAAGAEVSGTIHVMRAGQSIPIAITSGTFDDRTLVLSGTYSGQSVTFSGEYSGDRLTLRLPDASGPSIVLERVEHFPRTPLSAPATDPLPAPAGWRPANRAAELVEQNGQQVLRVDARPGDGIIWREGWDFREGTITLQLRGRNAPGQSFVGVAFRGATDDRYDAVYFRPFNFEAADPGRQRAVQYVSHPEYPWDRLRAENPGTFESAVSPVPNPDDWFRARIVVQGQRIEVFIDDASAPTLSVTALSEPRGGMVGYWVGNGSGGEFANLEITPTGP